MGLSPRFNHCMETLAASPLFQGLSSDELVAALKLLNARCHTFERGELVQRLGEPFDHVGILMSGEIEGSFDSERFDQINMNRFVAGDSYGAAYACTGTQASPIQLEALVTTEIVLLDVRPLMTPSGHESSSLREILLRNLLATVAQQGTFLARKVRILGQKSLRDRIIVFFRGLPADQDGWRELPFSQTTMAQFIGANRSAVSRELGRMMDDGLLRVDGRRVRLLEGGRS